MWHIFHKDILAVAVLRPEISYCKTRICVWFNQRSETLDDGSLFFAILNWHLSNNTIFVPCRNSNSIWFFFLLYISQPRPALFYLNSLQFILRRALLVVPFNPKESIVVDVGDRSVIRERTYTRDRSQLNRMKETINNLRLEVISRRRVDLEQQQHCPSTVDRCAVLARAATRNRERKVPTAQVELLNN